VAPRGAGPSPREGARPPVPTRGAGVLGRGCPALARGETAGSVLPRRCAPSRDACPEPPAGEPALRGPAVRGPAARGPADVPRSAGVRSKPFPVAGLAAHGFEAGVLPAAGPPDRDEPPAGLPAREVSDAWPDRDAVAAGLPGQVFRAAGLPARAPIAGFAPTARAGRRSGESGIECCTFREMH
jgi:hypothetical protein